MLFGVESVQFNGWLASYLFQIQYVRAVSWCMCINICIDDTYTNVCQKRCYDLFGLWHDFERDVIRSWWA